MEIIDSPTAATLQQAGATNVQAQPQAPQTAFIPPTPGFEFGTAAEAAAASFALDSLPYQLGHSAVSQLANGPEAVPDPNFNPYFWIRTQIPPDQQKDLELPIGQGIFEGAQSPADVQRIITARHTEEAERTAASQSGVGATIGGLLAQATDPLNYIGAGWVRGGTTAIARVGRAVVQQSLAASASEAGLHDLETLRTLHDSVVNVGGAALGAGGMEALLGGLGKALPHLADNGAVADHVATALDSVADHPVPPSGTGADAVHTTLPGANAALADAAGADVTVDAPLDLTAPAPTKLGGVTLMDRTIGGFSPMFKLLDADADSARNMLLALGETRGQVLVNADGSFAAPRPSAEAYASKIMTEAYTAPADATVGAIRTLNQKLGSMNAAQVDVPTFTDLVARALSNRLDGPEGTEAVAAAQGRYGAQGTDAVLDTARELADMHRKVNTEYMQPLLKQYGVVRDQSVLDHVIAQRESIRAQRDAEVAQLQQSAAIAKATSDRAASSDTMAAEATTAAEAHTQSLLDTRERYRAMLEPIEATIADQMAKPEPLGDNYGYAHIYKPAGVRANEAEMRAMLLTKFAGAPEKNWLLEQHGLTTDALSKLGATDPDRYSAILQQWGGDKHYARVGLAEQRLSAATERQRLADADVRRTSYFHGNAEANLKADTSLVGRTERARVAAEQAHAAAERDAARHTQQALIEASTAARQRTMDRATAETIARPDVGEAELADAMAKGRAAAEVRARAQRVRDAALQDPATAAREAAEPGAVDGAGDVAKAAQRAAKATDRADAAGQRAMSDPLESQAPSEPTRTAALAQLEGRLRATERQIADADARVAKHGERLSAIDEALTNFKRSLESRKDTEAALAGALRDANAAHDLSAKNVGELRRMLVRAQASPEIDKVVDELVMKLASDGYMSRAPLDRDDALGTSPRMRERSIDWTPAEHEKLVKLGIMRNDLPGILQHQYKSLAGDIGIRQSLGIDTPGGLYKSFSDALDVVKREYSERAAAAPNPKALAAVNTERQMALKNINLMKDRLIGADLSGVANKDSVFYWGAEKARQLTVMNYGPGFGLSSLTDHASMLMNHKLGDILQLNMSGMSKTLSEATHSTLLSIFHATEGSLHDTSALDAGTFESWAVDHGIGEVGTTTKKITGAVDYLAAKGMNLATRLSVLPQLTHFLKVSAGMDSLNQLADRAGRGMANLTKVEQAHMAQLGLDAPRLERLGRMISEHGTTDRGFTDPRMDLWANTPEGRAAGADLHIALQRDMSLAAPTVGVADTPALMSHVLGKLLLQFQTTNAVVYNRFISTAMQRMVHLGDWRMLGVVAGTMPLAALNWAVRDALSGKDPMERYAPQHMAETMTGLVDRAGFLGWTSPYVDAATKFVGVSGAASRYSQNNWYQSLGGTQVSQAVGLANLFNKARDVATGQPGAVGKLGGAAAAVSPLGVYARFVHGLMADPTQH